MGFGFISLFFLGWVYITAIISLAIVGAMFSGFILMGTMLFGDVVDYDETKTGKRREASYAGIQAIFQKPAISIAPAVFLWIILAFGFNEAASTQTPNAQLGIILAFSIIPGVVLLLGGLSVKFYRLSGPEWIKQKEELKKIHDKKEAEYIQHLKEKGLI
jgi:GPH family glycoside/pentoside/hexuronide:cation symporter